MLFASFFPQTSQVIQFKNRYVSLRIVLIFESVDDFLEAFVGQLQEDFFIKSRQVPKLLTANRNLLYSFELLTELYLVFNNLVPVGNFLLMQHEVDSANDGVQSIMEVNFAQTIVEGNLQGHQELPHLTLQLSLA